MLYSLRKNKVTTLLVALMVALCLVAIGSTGVFAANPTTHNNIKITFGDTTVPTPPESLMDFTFVSGNTYHADYNGSDAATFYPSTLSIYIQPTSGSISSITSTGVDFLEYDANGTPSVMNPVVINPNYFYTIQIADTAGTHSITVTNSNSDTFTVTFDRPKSGTTALTDMIVNGYLPGVSQYATGKSYGSISTDDANSLANQDLVKTIRGNSGTMVSLGSSGYIQYELATPITNSNRHKWGIDFVVKGNPFNGNPEAGMVMVAEKDGQGNPDTWYRLAGSRHYEADTVMNTNVTYTKNASNIGVTYGGNTTTFTTTMAWWPLFAAKSATPAGENYGAASGVQTSKITNVSYPSNDTTITYQNRTVVADDATAGLSGNNATNFYGYGYADVRAGSGFVNPYASLPSAGGGADGFDLAWAVDASGNPVDLTGKDIYFIQVYTATVYNAGIFGETSTEVASLTAASNETASVGTTSAPTMSFTAGAYTTSVTGSTGGYTDITIPSGNTATTFTLTATASANLWLNNTKATSATPVTFDVPASGQTKLVRVVAQNGDAQPYILLVRVHK